MLTDDRAFSRISFMGATTRLIFGSAIVGFACGPKPLADDPSDDATGDTTPSEEPETSATTWSDDPDDSTTGTEENTCVPGIGDCPDGFKCQPYRKEDGACCVDADMCVPITGNQQWDEECIRERYGDDCAKDLVCFAGTSAKEGPGRCKELCDATEPSSCDHLHPNAFCQAFADGKMPLCEIVCHPLRPDCPRDEDGCYWGGSEFLCVPPHPEPGKGNDGDGCYTIQSCSPGLICLSDEQKPGCASDYCCTTFCDLTAEQWPCRDGEGCVPMFDHDDPEVDPTWLDIGFCGVDPE